MTNIDEACKTMDRAIAEIAALRAKNEVLRKALECILPYLPKSMAKDDGPNAFSGHVKAADTVRAALSTTKEPK
jgi:hypothetical protein